MVLVVVVVAVVLRRLLALGLGLALREDVADDGGAAAALRFRVDASETTVVGFLRTGGIVVAVVVAAVSVGLAVVMGTTDGAAIAALFVNGGCLLPNSPAGCCPGMLSTMPAFQPSPTMRGMADAK